MISYQYVKFPKVVLDEGCQWSYAPLIHYIKLMKYYIRKPWRLENSNSLNSPSFISCCQHHMNPMTSQLLADFESDPLVCSRDNRAPTDDHVQTYIASKFKILYWSWHVRVRLEARDEQRRRWSSLNFFFFKTKHNNLQFYM